MFRVPDCAGEGVEDTGVLAAPGQPLESSVEFEWVLAAQPVRPAEPQPDQVLRNGRPDPGEPLEVGAGGAVGAG